MDGNYGGFEIDMSIKEINSIAEQYKNIAAKINADFDSISAAWQGDSAMRLISVSECIGDDSANIKRYFAELCEMMELRRLEEYMEKESGSAGEGE